MCFVLYAGTTRPIPRREWRKDAPDLSVEPLTERDVPIKAHFRNPEVQCVGSTAGCGCDFPHATLQNGCWPEIGYPEGFEAAYPESLANSRRNRQALVDLLRTTGDKVVELYGVWDGTDTDFSEEPMAREEITIERILDPDFVFKERGFYEVRLGT
jgi:hypothetical protein